MGGESGASRRAAPRKGILVLLVGLPAVLVFLLLTSTAGRGRPTGVGPLAGTAPGAPRAEVGVLVPRAVAARSPAADTEDRAPATASESGALASTESTEPPAFVRVQVRGSVSDSGGRPASDVRVHGQWKSPTRNYAPELAPGIPNVLGHHRLTSRGWEGRSDADGNFAFELDLPRPAEETVNEVVVTAGTPGGMTSTRLCFAQGELVRDGVDLVLPGSEFVRGRFVLEDGSPVANASVRVHKRSPGRHAAPLWVRTDAAGEFELRLSVNERLLLGLEEDAPILDAIVNRFAEHALSLVRLELVLLDAGGQSVRYDLRRELLEDVRDPLERVQAPQARSLDRTVHFLDWLPVELELRAGKHRGSAVVTEDEVTGSHARVELLLGSDLVEHVWDPALGRPVPKSR